MAPKLVMFPTTKKVQAFNTGLASKNPTLGGKERGDPEGGGGGGEGSGEQAQWGAAGAGEGGRGRGRQDPESNTFWTSWAPT